MKKVAPPESLPQLVLDLGVHGLVSARLDEAGKECQRSPPHPRAEQPGICSLDGRRNLPFPPEAQRCHWNPPESLCPWGYVTQGEKRKGHS